MSTTFPKLSGNIKRNTFINHCVIEVVLKDISTVRHEPRRLWEWASIASEVTAECA